MVYCITSARRSLFAVCHTVLQGPCKCNFTPVRILWPSMRIFSPTYISQLNEMHVRYADFHLDRTAEGENTDKNLLSPLKEAWLSLRLVSQNPESLTTVLCIYCAALLNWMRTVKVTILYEPLSKVRLQ